MAEEKSVLFPILIGCGLLGLLCFLVCGGGMVFFVPRFAQQAEQMMEQMTQEMARQQMLDEFPEGWRPPAADVGDEELFPDAIGNFSLLKNDTAACPPEFGLADREGRHATYESALTNIEVYAYSVDREEHKEVMRAVQQKLGENFMSQVTSNVTQSNYESLYFSVSPPDTTGWLWWSEGWMFLILSEDQFAATAFETAYLDAIQPPGPDEPAAPDDTGEGEAGEPKVGDTGTEGLTDPPLAEEGDFPPPPPKPDSLQPGGQP